MRVVKALGRTFTLREGEECKEVWDGEDNPPPQLYTFATTDGSDGLMWESLEEYWVEFALHPAELSGKVLLQCLVAHLTTNPNLFS